MSPGNCVKLARKAAGISQPELAARAATCQSAISRLENNHISPTVATLEKLVEACGYRLSREVTHVVGHDHPSN